MKLIRLTSLVVAAFVLCMPGFSGAQISGTEHSQAQIEEAATLPALNHNEIIQVQQCLHNQGFDPGVADGLLGERTRQALQQWQAHYGYTQTGELATSDQRAMLIDCIPHAQMEQTAQTEQIDASAQLPPSPKKAWEIAKTDINRGFRVPYTSLAPQRAQLIAKTGRGIMQTGVNGWLIALYTGLGVVGAAAISGGDDDPAPPAVVTPPAPPPVFASSTPYMLEVVEGTTGNFGVPVTATDPNGARLAYSLSGPAAGAFSIDANTGQLSVATGATLDASAKSSYTFSVTATNPTGQTAARTVSITVVSGLQRDWEALKALYNATDGPNWTNKRGWESGVAATQMPTAEELESWFGVTLTDNRVTSLSLRANNLSGTIPTELGNMTTMRILVLATN